MALIEKYSIVILAHHSVWLSLSLVAAKSILNMLTQLSPAPEVQRFVSF